MVGAEIWVSETLRPLELVTQPAFAAPQRACDSHMHVFDADWPGVADARYTLPEGSLAQYRAVAGRLGLERAVFVQPSYYGTDNGCMLAAMAQFGSACRGVVFLPPDADVATITDFHVRGVRGIRLDFFKAQQDGMDRIRAKLRDAAHVARGMGWHVELYSPGPVTWALRDDLAKLDIDFCINHLGYLKTEDGFTDADFTHFLDLVRTPHCWVKLTGPYRAAPDDPARADAMAQALIAAAPQRMVWGTDWPHLPHGSRDTGALFNRLATWCPDATVRDDILVRNPERLYGF